MNFLDRVEDPDSDVPFIKLTEDESNIYPGAGWHLVKVQDGHIHDYMSIDGNMHIDDVASGNFTDQANLLAKWAGNDEVYLGMYSCHTFCLPEKFELHKMAKIARLSMESFLAN